MTRLVKSLLLALFACTALLVPLAFGQEPGGGKDDDLEGFLKKLDDSDKPAPKSEKAGESKKGDAKSGGVSDKDKDLDGFLEKLGQTKETPAPDEKRGLPGPGDQPPDPTDGKKKTEELKGRDKQTDEHLEELTGRVRKKKGQNQGQDSGPLSEIIKEMRDVEQRLGKTDTGDETRKKQEQIVKQLEQVIQQMRQSGSSSGKKKMVLVKQAGQKPGDQQPGQQPGTTGGNAPHNKPEKPDLKRSLFGSKDEWGHLPDQLRQEMDNIFKEEALPSRENLIKRYYLSLTKKTLSREE